VRDAVEKQSLQYIAKLKENSLIYEDTYVEDYLQDIVKKIHPGELHKGRKVYLTVKILNHEDDMIYAFENGTILVSTQTIANLSGEKELYEKLSRAVAHIVLDHNMMSINLLMEDARSRVGIFYAADLKNAGKQVAADFMKYFINNQEPSEVFLENKDFIERISNIISYTAWQEFYSQHYAVSLKLVERIIDTGLATDEDYLLKAKILRITGSDNRSVTEALNYLEMADSLSNHSLLDNYPEKGVLLMKAELWSEALTTFEAYRILLRGQAGMETELRWCSQMIQKCKRNIFL